MLISRKSRRSYSVKSARAARSQNHLALFSRARRFVARLLTKFERTIHIIRGSARIFLQPRRPLSVRPVHSITKIHLLPQLILNDFTLGLANSRNGAPRKWRAGEMLAAPNYGAAPQKLGDPVERVFTPQAVPVSATKLRSLSPEAPTRDRVLPPAPLVFLHSAHRPRETGISAGPGTEEHRPTARQIPQSWQSRTSSLEAEPEQVARLTDQVLQAIDRRIVAQRERRGRL